MHSKLCESSVALCVLVGAALLFASSARGGGADAYEARGYLKYATLQDPGKPVYKLVMMFDVQVHTNGWHIRTEPVIENQGGVGYFEASGGSNNSVLYLTASEDAYDPSQSPFGSLRTELKESEKEAVYFMRDHPEYKVEPPPPPRRRSAPGADPDHLDNVAVASIFSGEYPPVDPGFRALLWFAFTPPRPRADGTNKMLLQIWDDGSGLAKKVRFRRARWSQFAEQPALVSNAVYNWAGREFAVDGVAASIGTSGSDIAARYEVLESTNWMGLALPLKFQLTRFGSKKSSDQPPRVGSIVIASVVRVRAGSGQPAQVTFPGKTYVSDYRLSTGGLNGTRYLLNSSNSLPTVPEVEQGAPYAPYKRKR